MSKRHVWPPTIYKHSSGNARIRIGGRDYYLGPFGSEKVKREYARILAEYAGTGHAPIPEGADASHTVATVVGAYFAEAIRDRGAKDRELEVTARPAAALVRLYGDLPARDFDAPRLETLRNAMATGSWMTEAEQAAARVVGWCRNVVNRHLVRVGTIWRWAERRKLVPAGSYATLKTVPGLTIRSKIARQTARARPASLDELRAVRRQAPPVIAYMLTVQWWTGMRSAEVREMRAGDLDRADPGCWVYRPEHHKTEHRGQTRAVPLGRVAQAIIAKLSAGKAPGDYVFTPARVRKRPCYTRFTYAKAVRRAADAAGLTGWHAYLLRHGAKQRITRLYGLDVARAVLGQKSLGTTNGYGDAIDLDAARKAMLDQG